MILWLQLAFFYVLMMGFFGCLSNVYVMMMEIICTRGRDHTRDPGNVRKEFFYRSPSDAMPLFMTMLLWPMMIWVFFAGCYAVMLRVMFQGIINMYNRHQHDRWRITNIDQTIAFILIMSMLSWVPCMIFAMDAFRSPLFTFIVFWFPTTFMSVLAHLIWLNNNCRSYNNLRVTRVAGSRQTPDEQLWSFM